MPPAYEGKKVINPSGVDVAYVDSLEIQQILLTLFSGRLYFSKWLVFGDDFHYTLSELKNFSFPFGKITVSDKNRLMEIFSELKIRIKETLQFKVNAGKKIGTFNTSKLWDLTDESDLIFLRYITDNPIVVNEELKTFVSQMAVSMKKDGVEES